LWHGANFTFILWGGFHGIILVMERFFHIHSILKKSKIHIRIGYYTLTLFLICFGWMIFRVANVEELLMLTQKIFLFSIDNGKDISLHYAVWPAIIFFLVNHLWGFLTENIKSSSELLKTVWYRFWAIRVISYTSVISYMLFFIPETNNAFIYFQF